MNIVVHQFADLGHMPTFPLAAGQIVAAARQCPELRDIDFQIETARRPIAEQLDRYTEPDVLAFSFYVWNEQHSLRVAAAARLRFPHTTIVFGGPSVPRNTARARAFLQRHPHIDVLVFGEGEITFRELLLRRVAGTDLAGTAGSAARGADDIVFGPPRPRIRDFSETGSPYLDGTFDQWRTDNPQVVSALLETNRGCPFRCTFCDWGQATASRVNDIPMARVLGEIDWLAEHQVPYVYIIDANFGIRKRDPEIVAHIASNKATAGTPHFCYFHLTKNATVRNLATVETLMRANIGCHIAISMQSYQPEVLAAIERDNISIEVFEQLRRTCAQREIPTANELLLGLPEQTYEGFVDGVIRSLSPWPADSFFLYPARLLENSAMASDAHRQRYGLETRMSTVSAVNDDTVSTELEEVVIATRTMPFEQWRAALFFGSLVGAFYNLHVASVLLHAVRTLVCDVTGWCNAVIIDVRAAPPGSVFAAIREDFDTLVDNLEGGSGALKISRPDLPAGPWEAHELIAVRALCNYPAFTAELEDSTRRWAQDTAIAGDMLEELFAVQRRVIPDVERGSASTLQCQWDWATWWASLTDTAVEVATNAKPMSKGVPMSPTTLRWEPPVHQRPGQSASDFALAHIGQLYAKRWRPSLGP